MRLDERQVFDEVCESMLELAKKSNVPHMVISIEGDRDVRVVPLGNPAGIVHAVQQVKHMIRGRCRAVILVGEYEQKKAGSDELRHVLVAILFRKKEATVRMWHLSDSGEGRAVSERPEEYTAKQHEIVAGGMNFFDVFDTEADYIA